jgi:Zn-dependent protease with chaperone function
LSDPDDQNRFDVTGHGGPLGVGGPATLRFRGRELFLSAGDLPEVALDLHQCEASVVGKCLDVLDTSRNLGFSTRNPGVYARLQEVAPEELSEELTAMAGLLYQSKKSESQVYWFGGVTLLLLLVGGFFFLSHVTRNVIDWVPIEVDQTIGEPIHEMMLQEYEVVDDPVLLQATGEIFDSLLPHLPIEGLEPHWTLVKNPQVNAYCLPGGSITIFTGLLKNARSADEVAAVLAHELAHATERHGIRQITQVATAGLAIQLLVGDLGGIAAAGGEAAQGLLINGYSRDHEREADAVGLRMLTAAGWDPLAMSRFFDRLAKEGGQQPPAWFSTHPHPEERAQTIRQKVTTGNGTENPEAVSPPVIDWNQVQKALENLQ